MSGRRGSPVRRPPVGSSTRTSGVRMAAPYTAAAAASRMAARGMRRAGTVIGKRRIVAGRRSSVNAERSRHSSGSAARPSAAPKSDRGAPGSRRGARCPASAVFAKKRCCRPGRERRDRSRRAIRIPACAPPSRARRIVISSFLSLSILITPFSMSTSGSPSMSRSSRSWVYRYRTTTWLTMSSVAAPMRPPVTLLSSPMMAFCTVFDIVSSTTRSNGLSCASSRLPASRSPTMRNTYTTIGRRIFSAIGQAEHEHVVKDFRVHARHYPPKAGPPRPRGVGGAAKEDLFLPGRGERRPRHRECLLPVRG